MTERKRKLINCAVTVLEALLICADSWSIQLLWAFTVANLLVLCICTVRPTKKFTEMLRSSNYLLFRQHQWAFDSGNILTIKSALRNEELREEERAAMQEATKYLTSLLWMDGALNLAFFTRIFLR